MVNTEEQRLDIIKYCNLLLNGYLSHFEQTDDRAQGRMITQLEWLKERAENHDLPLPVAKEKLASLLYIYTTGEIYALYDNEQPILEQYNKGTIEKIMQRIISLTYEGSLLTKKEYFPYIVRLIDALILLIEKSSYELENYREGFFKELERLKKLIIEEKIEPPVGACMPDYPNYVEVEYLIRLYPEGKKLFSIVDNLIFNGRRPDTWLTPKDADRESQKLLDEMMQQ